MSRSPLAAFAVLLALAPAAAAQEPRGSTVIQDRPAVSDPNARVQGVTPTPTSTATPLPFETATPEAGETPTPVPSGRDAYITPGYGSAAQQPEEDKRHERAMACSTSNRPPTSHMVSVPGVVEGDPGGSWVPIAIAIAIGAAVFAGIAFALRRRGEKRSGPGALEGVATLVAICAGLAGLAAQFIPAASVKERPAREATLIVRDVKPRITHQEYLTRTRLSRHGLSKTDLQEVGNVVWLQLGLEGFKGRDLSLEYGLYDLNAHEALLPGSSRSLTLETPHHDVQTSFVPVWVGYPRSTRFMAEFRLVDERGVEQIAATGPMRGSTFRYACEKRS